MYFYPDYNEVEYDFTPFDEYLERIRHDNQITVKHDWFDESDPSVSIPSKRKILINDNYLTSIVSSFEYAHELGHVLLFSDSQKLYGFSELVTSAEERAAHLWALNAFYQVASQNDYIPNYVDAMTALGLPNSFEAMIRKVWHQYSDPFAIN
ncbi:hypothetical protein EFN49_06340 [Leuconostoc citreum]|uniref:hypothetical protein n=1 Tax=Leuconostoc citreum TaxID=33964 RepID=UPI0021A42077|nr:hypothetical protein [Leuconostoc citreum]MCT3075308.1 hypothetical protein [Leuconostoc citreum]